MKYEFHVGDYVETKDGDIGYITHIIDSTKLEPPYICYTTNNGESFIYPIYSWTHCYKIEDKFNRIGKYDFTKKDECKDKCKIEKLEMRSYLDATKIVCKINELVEAVNRLEEKVDE